MNTTSTMPSGAVSQGLLTAGWRLQHSYAQLPALLFTPAQPTPVSAPKVAVLNGSLAGELGLDPAALARPENAGWFTGNSLPPGALPLAQAYAGHQFGNFVMLGDGRAILLGEQITPGGETCDIQLKGAGRTRYSRGGDGRAALGPMLREYIVSEAMHALGIPTTRSLAVATTGDPVFRERTLPGAVLTRVASSHLRVGTFEFAAEISDSASRASPELDPLHALADYTLRRHYPALLAAEQPYVALLQAILQKQAALVARWQLIGFVHGVMNTDNMALSGETIDYGPCAFLDVYEPTTVFSSIDHHGRYAYANQPGIAHWNLSRLASAMLPLLHADEEKAIAVGNEILGTYPAIFQAHWLTGMRAKLGLFSVEAGDDALAGELLTIMQQHSLDFTNTFRDLASALSLPAPHDHAVTAYEDFTKWSTRWRARINRQSESIHEAQALMRRTNPAFIPRNHKVEAALAAATADGDLNLMERLLDVLRHPFAYDRPSTEFSTPPLPGDPPYQTFCGT